MANVYFDETAIQNHMNICKDICELTDPSTLSEIDTELENRVVRWGFISGTSRDEFSSITTGLTTIDTFVIAKTSGGVVGLFSYGKLKGGTASGFGWGEEEKMATVPTGTVTVFNGKININGTQRYGLQGTYRWMACGSV